MKPVIFTDLDGTLLDPGDYSVAKALPALGRITSMGIPLIFASSKTRAEIEDIRKRLSNTHPFISENGACVFIPVDYFPFTVEGAVSGGYITITLGKRYEEIRKIFNEIRASMKARVTGFGDMTKEEVSRLTGLSLHDAGLAKIRDFDEPFIFEKEKKTHEEEFLREIEKKGLRWTEDKFYHINGTPDKGDCLKILKKYYGSLYGNITTIGLGDGLNDLEILGNVDYPVLIQRYSGDYAPVNIPGVIKAAGIGPEGWNKAMTGILDTLEAAGTYTC